MYKRHLFPPEIIQHAVWLYHRFNLSTRNIEDLLAARGIAVSYESIRLRCIKFGPKYAERLKRRHQGYGDTFFIDDVNGQKHLTHLSDNILDPPPGSGARPDARGLAAEQSTLTGMA